MFSKGVSMKFIISISLFLYSSFFFSMSYADMLIDPRESPSYLPEFTGIISPFELLGLLIIPIIAFIIFLKRRKKQ